MRYYYFDFLGKRHWSQVKLGTLPLLPLSMRPIDLAWDRDVVFIHWSDFVFPKDGSATFISAACGRGMELPEAEAADQERQTALARLSEAAASNLGGKGGSSWYFYSGDRNGAQTVVTTAEECGGSPDHANIPELSFCPWVTLTSQPLSPSATPEQITRWMKDVLNIADPSIEQFEQMFRLFLDAEMIARFADEPALPEWLARIARSNVPRPNWQHFFQTARAMAPEGRPSTWPFSEFPDDIRQLAIANCVLGRSSWFDDADECFSDYRENWKARYLKSVP